MLRVIYNEVVVLLIANLTMEKPKNNSLLSRLAREDQADREPAAFKGNERRVAIKDKKRREQVLRLLKERKVKTSEDYFNAALIFQHGDSLGDYKKAEKYAHQSLKMGYEHARWLYAAATDRSLVHQGKKQKYGTQYETVVLNQNSPTRAKKVIRLSPYDRRTSDETRRRFDVPPLKDLIKRQKELTETFYG